jgi:hypothetical protein
MRRKIIGGLATLPALLLAACSVSFTVGKGAPPIHSDPSFGAVVLATRIDSVTKEPLDRVDSFDTNVRAMNATIEAKNVRAGAEFRFHWTKGGNDVGTIVMSVPTDIHDNWVSAAIFPNGPVPLGSDWRLEVLYNGKVISSKNFSVTGTPPST